MLTLTLKRTAYSEQGTAGVLLLSGARVCYTLELPWRFNARGVSCIPTGTYNVAHMPRSASGKYRDVYHVTNVPGRSGVLIHTGNFAGDKTKGMRSDVLGCILPGKRLGILAGQLAVIDSRGGLRDLHSLTGRKPFTIHVIGEAPCSKPSSEPAAES